MSEDNGKKAMLFIAGDRVDDDDLSFFGTAGRRIRADESAVWNVDLSMVVPHFEDKTVEQQETMARRIEFPVRKVAHMTEYAILALLLLGMITKDRITRKQLLAVICLVAAYAATDEYHQLFVPGRSGQVRDVVIDTVGGTLGLGAWLAVHRLLTP